MVALCYGFARFALGLFLPQIDGELNLGPSLSGVISGGSFAGYCIAIIAAATLTERFGARVVAMAAAILAAIGMAGIALAPTPAFLAVAVLLAGSSTGRASRPVAAAVAAAVRNETGREFTYRLGVMVETPRAALKAGDIAPHTAFLSFGTNDLTQMTYGLSRDDAGKFMSDYVKQGVFPEDPFHTLDTDGVGELLMIGAERARAARADLILSICGEHGGNAESIAFCRSAGFDYVSCSPFRVPVARLAAAQARIRPTLPPRAFKTS